ncbi:phosphotransferase [Bacteroidales bacterium OttesenSCG-928-C19]|nr:phosphotransferase [Bacteroidales bacterium OttesenSCG-928-C19]
MQISNIEKLFSSWTKEEPIEIKQISVHGSNRSYYRIKSEHHQCLAAVNSDVRENKAFIYLSNYFRSQKLNVPEVFVVNDDYTIYLVEDLNDTTLYEYISAKETRFDNTTLSIYKNTLKHLLDFQFAGQNGLDYSICYPRHAFDRQSMQWDLNYFKYYFLKLAQIPFDEQLLENDFETLIQFLLDADNDYFLYRDFQSRNIMLKDEEIYFIDFQGGRKGPLQYDVASLLYDAKAEIPQNVRIELLDFYIAELQKRKNIDAEKFKTQFYCFVLIRIMQAMGSYGFRGFYEGKSHFLKSILPALENIRLLLEDNVLPDSINYLKNVLDAITKNERLRKLVPEEVPSEKLTVQIFSFSYKKGYPIDVSGNGGGYIFDCRALPNPGRFPEYKTQTGKDQSVIDFLEREEHVEKFVTNAYTLVEQSVKVYIDRGFTHLLVAFGCTGGQHRSVYCAERMKTLLSLNFDCNIQIIHREQNF